MLKPHNARFVALAQNVIDFSYQILSYRMDGEFEWMPRSPDNIEAMFKSEAEALRAANKNKQPHIRNIQTMKIYLS